LDGRQLLSGLVGTADCQFADLSGPQECLPEPAAEERIDAERTPGGYGNGYIEKIPGTGPIGIGFAGGAVGVPGSSPVGLPLNGTLVAASHVAEVVVNDADDDVTPQVSASSFLTDQALLDLVPEIEFNGGGQGSGGDSLNLGPDANVPNVEPLGSIIHTSIDDVRGQVSGFSIQPIFDDSDGAPQVFNVV